MALWVSSGELRSNRKAGVKVANGGEQGWGPRDAWPAGGYMLGHAAQGEQCKADLRATIAQLILTLPMVKGQH